MNIQHALGDVYTYTHTTARTDAHKQQETPNYYGGHNLSEPSF